MLCYDDPMKKIQLPNRYGSSIYLESVGHGEFKLCGDLEYVSVSGKMDNILAVDPSGGPFIAIGDTIAGMRIESIRYEDGTFYIHAHVAD